MKKLISQVDRRYICVEILDENLSKIKSQITVNTASNDDITLGTLNCVGDLDVDCRGLVSKVKDHRRICIGHQESRAVHQCPPRATCVQT